MEKNTRQRAAIREALAHAARPLLPQEVLEAAQVQVPGLGIATVYRNLKALVDEGALRSVNLPGDNPRFETAGLHHHHHFQCQQCQKVFDVHGCPGNLAALAPPGFTVADHDLVLYGRCSDCPLPGSRQKNAPVVRKTVAAKTVDHKPAAAAHRHRHG
jgi:Fur family transcriptional regulator, ferric uptake regulator